MSAFASHIYIIYSCFFVAILASPKLLNLCVICDQRTGFVL